MLLIGNQIRLARPPLAAAVEQRYEMLIQSLAWRQVEAGATWLLVDMGPQRKASAADMAWLVQTIHDSVRVPLVLRSDDPAAMEAGIKVAKERVLLDATLPGVSDPEPYLALALRHNAKLALSACPGSLPLPTEERLERVTGAILPQVLDAGLTLADLYVDPLVAALSCDQPMLPATVETLRLLKVAADPAPNTLVHLDDVADGAGDAAKPFITQAFLTMLLAAGLDALVANPLDADLMDVIRVVRERDPATAYDQLLVRLYDVTKADVELDSASVDLTDPAQSSLFKTVKVLNNKLIYADSYLSG